MPRTDEKGRSFQGIRRLSQALELCDASNRVHMAVFSASIGMRVQVSEDGYLETSLNVLHRCLLSLKG